MEDLYKRRGLFESWLSRFLFFAAISIPVFLLLLLVFDNLWWHLTASLTCGVLFTLLAIFADRIELKQHVEIPNGKVFSRIKSEFNFDKETIEDYHGLYGTYEGYHIKLYFDSNAQREFWHSGKASRKATVVMLYFEPVTRLDGKLDIRFYRDMDEKCAEGMRYLKYKDFPIVHRSWSYMYFCTSGVGFDRITRGMKRLSNFAKELEVKPINKSRVDELIAENPGWHGPPIETFQNQLIS